MFKKVHTTKIGSRHIIRCQRPTADNSAD